MPTFSFLLADTAAKSPPPVASLIVLLMLGIALLLLMILKLRLQAFLALLVASVAVAVGATFVNPDAIALAEIGDTIKNSMGGALGFIATIIGIGAIFGAILEHSGGTQSLANSLVNTFGKERAPWAMLLTGFIISIPVFLDVALVILAPLLYALSRDTGKPLLTFGLPLVVGMAVTHAFVPPTPGPVAVAYFLNVSLGWVILFGFIVGFPTALLLGPPVCNYFARRIKVDLPEPDDVETPESDQKHLKLPSFSFILFLIGLPIVLILCNSIVEQILTADIPAGLGVEDRKDAVKEKLDGAAWPYQILLFLGHPVIALLLTTLVTIYFLGTRRGVSKDHLVEIATKSLGPAGIIILITGAGGVFKGVLGKTGIADALKIAFGDSGIPILVLAWIFATLVRVAQGSATVAMITAAGLMAGFCEGLSQPMLALVVVCIAAGATGFSHVNDSGFWMISRYMRMTEAQTLRSWTILSTLVSFVGFAIALLVSLFVS